MKPDIDLSLLILAAGRGTRMRNGLPKVLHHLAGRSLIAHVVDLGRTAGASQVTIVLAPDMEQIEAELQAVHPNPHIAYQTQALGTGDAVRAALDGLPQQGTVIVVFGDTPLITPSTIIELKEAREAQDAAIVVMGMAPPDPHGYGRLQFSQNGDLIAIVEHVRADAELRSTGLCNSGVMAIDAVRCRELIEAIPPQTDNGEYYLTDSVALAIERGWRCQALQVPHEQGHGVNSQLQLAQANKILQERLRLQLLDEGVIMPAPETVQLAFDTRAAPGVTIEPFVVFGPGVSVASAATIRSFSHLEGTQIGPGAVIGPYARLRPGTRIGDFARIGNFVETKNAQIAAGAKANHLSYLGDCTIGSDSNIGAGTITCNYDGFNKHQTEIGAHVFVGSNTALVAPLSIGDGAIVGAGSTITGNVPADAIALTRPTMSATANAAPKLRERLSMKKSQPGG